MEALLIFILLFVLITIVIVSAVIYRKIYMKKINNVLNNNRNKKVLRPRTFVLFTISLLTVLVAVLWSTLFSSGIRFIIDSDYSVSNYSKISSSIIEVYEVDDHILYFTEYDFLHVQLDQNLQVINTNHNSVTFEKDGTVGRVQYRLYEDEYEISKDPRMLEWSIKEYPFGLVEFKTVIQTLALIDMESTINDLGMLTENGKYEIRIEGSLIPSESGMEFYQSEGASLRLLDEEGNHQEIDLTTFDYDRSYIIVEVHRYEQTSPNTEQAVESIWYYFDVTEYIVDYNNGVDQ